MTARLFEFRLRFGTDANPIHTLRHIKRAIGFHGALKVLRAQRVEQGGVELQARLAAGEDDIGIGANRLFRPETGNRFGQRIGIGEFVAILPVRADEIRIAKTALRGGAVFFAA